jgi:DNA invertase Pin-like site-specific DNA recombinase
VNRLPAGTPTAPTTTPLTVGYVRTVAGQSPADQTTALIHAGVAQDSIHIEQASGYKAAWPERDLLLSRLRRGDTVKITRMDRLFHSVQNLITLGTELRDRGIRIQAVEQGIDSESSDGRDLFGMLASLTELNRQFVTASVERRRAARRAVPR